MLALALALPLFAFFAFFQGCGEIGGEIVQVAVPDPPVSVTFRQSMINGYVLQLHNRSVNRVVASIYVKNDATTHSKSCSFGVSPNDMSEVGLMEMDWAFEKGEHGYVAIDGYRKKLYFKILESGQYQTWFDF